MTPSGMRPHRALKVYMKSVVVRVWLIGFMWLVAFSESSHAIPRLVVGVVRGFPGRTVDVPVSLRYRTNDLRDVVAFQADVVFDASGVDDSAPSPGAIVSNHVLASSAPFAGSRRLLVYSQGNEVLTNGEVARIPFNVGSQEFRNFTLRLTNVILVRADASQVFGDETHGAIAVSQVYLGLNGSADGFLDSTTDGTEQCYIIQATSDFQTWSNVQTNSTDETLLQFIDPDAGSFPKRFYRAISCAAPSGLLPASGEGIATITPLLGGSVQFDFSGEAGRSYVLQASTNLADWENVRTNVGVGGPISFTDSLTRFTRRFYRVRPAD